MLIVEFDGPPYWSLDASETGESTKYPWVGVAEGTAGPLLMLLTPPPLPKGILYSALPSFTRSKRPSARRTQQPTSTISRKIGDCEQSIARVTLPPCKQGLRLM